MSQPTCKIEGCEKPVHGRDLCGTHYKRLRVHGDTETVLQGGPQRMESATCSVPDCEKPSIARELCATHYARWSKHGDPLHGGPVRVIGRGTCTVEGCGEPHIARGYCRKHYATWQRHGDPSGEPAPDGREERWLKQRDGILRRNYGITQEEYEQMAEAQHGRCKLCGCVPKRRRETRLGRPWTGLVVDHAHDDSGRIRGLLCIGCNIAIGRVDRVGLDTVVAYYGL